MATLRHEQPPGDGLPAHRRVDRAMHEILLTSRLPCRSDALRREISAIASAQARVQGDRQNVMRAIAEERGNGEKREAAQAAAQEREDFEEAARLQDEAENGIMLLRDLEGRLSLLGRESEVLDDRRHALEKELVECWSRCSREMEVASQGYVGEFEVKLRQANRELARAQDDIDDQKEQVSVIHLMAKVLRLSACLCHGLHSLHEPT